ncbi:MAG: PepSY domain-containing protein [Emcibacter sp.]|nr:PepSY domain-containing protein [Emcibacter sp.]
MDIMQEQIKKKKTNYNLILRRIHKWVALIVGLQLVLWTMSGFLMSFIPIEDVHGDHLWDKFAPAEIIRPETVVVDAKYLMQKYGDQDITNIRLYARNGRAIYGADIDAETVYFDAINGEPVGLVAETEAISIAQESYRWTGKYRSVEYVTDPEKYSEIRGGEFPIWRINFDDNVNSSLYVSPTEGKVVRVRSDIWRLYDFFWMLHIMDYDTRDDFNNLLLILAASVAFFIALSGIILVFYAFSKKDFRWLGKP